VLIALAIVGVILGAVFTVFGNGRLWHASSNELDAALSLADDKLEAVGVAETLKAGASEGVFNRFRWRLVVTPYEDKDRQDSETEPLAPTFRLFRAEVTVSWREGVRPRQIALSTLRLVRTAP